MFGKKSASPSVGPLENEVMLVLWEPRGSDRGRCSTSSGKKPQVQGFNGSDAVETVGRQGPGHSRRRWTDLYLSTEGRPARMWRARRRFVESLIASVPDRSRHCSLG